MAWIIDESEVFAVNERINVKTDKITDSQTLTVIDDFYKNPDLVREFTHNAPATLWKQVVRDYPAARSHLRINLSAVTEIISRITQDIYNMMLLDDIPFISNIYKYNTMPAGLCSMPHSDQYIFAGLVYLNSPEECSGGTGFYQHKKSGHYAVENPDEFLNYYGDLEKGYEFITESNDQWELIKMAEMKYNRLVLYKSNLFHSAYIDREAFKEHYRINQVLFFDKVVMDNTVFSKINNYQVRKQQNNYILSMPDSSDLTLSEPLFAFFDAINQSRTFKEIIDQVPRQFELLGKNYFQFRRALSNLLNVGIISFKN